MTLKYKSAARIVATDDQVSCNLEGKSLLLQVSSGHYFGLNEVGSLVWEKVQAGSTFDEIVEAVTATYAAGREQVENDVENLLRELEAEGLIQVTDANRT